MTIITVARAIIMVDGKLLLTQNKQLGHDQWCLPGGKIDGDETPVEAMRRELREETAVEGEVGRLAYVHQLFSEKNGEQVQRLEFFFVINNPQDFMHATLAGTTHGELEINSMEFKKVSEVDLLPPFLKSELLDEHEPREVAFFRTSL